MTYFWADVCEIGDNGVIVLNGWPLLLLQLNFEDSYDHGGRRARGHIVSKVRMDHYYDLRCADKQI